MFHAGPWPPKNKDPLLLQATKENQDLKASLATSMDQNMQLVTEKNQLKAQMSELSRSARYLVALLDLL